MVACFGNSKIQYPISPFAILKADIEKNYDDLYECIFKVILRSHVELNMNS